MWSRAVKAADLEGSAATYDNPLASSAAGTFSEVVLLLLSESDLDSLSREVGSLLSFFPSNDVFSMVGRWWWLRVKACSSLEPAFHGFFSRETRAAGLRCWLLILFWLKHKHVKHWWQEKLMLIMPHLALRGGLMRVSSQEDPQCPSRFVSHTPGLTWTFGPSRFSP